MANSAPGPQGTNGIHDIETPDLQAQATQPPCRLFRQDRKKSVELYKAALNGDWETAKRMLVGDDILRASITKGLETVLHVAAGARQTKFVQKLVEKMQPEDLKLPDENGNTAFCLAAAAGAKDIAEIMIKRASQNGIDLAKVRGSGGVTPLYIAAKYGQADMVRFLHPLTGEILARDAQIAVEDRTGTLLFFAYIDIGLFDLALTLLRDSDSKLATIEYGDRGTALHMLARMPSAFSSKNSGIRKTLINLGIMSKQTDHALELVRHLWEKVLEYWGISEDMSEGTDDQMVLNQIRNPSNLLFEAAKLGNFKFLAELICLHPNLIWEVDENNQTIFHIAVLHRHVNIFNQIHKIGAIKDIIANSEVGSDNSEVGSDNSEVGSDNSEVGSDNSEVGSDNSEVVSHNSQPGSDNSQPGSKNNILHLAAKLPHSSRLNEVSGAALQMQRELIWFQEVEKTLQPSSREKQNSKGLTPREIFTIEHTKLLKEGEKWMKDRAHFCMLVATIITSVVFAAAFSVPGGNNDIKGTPNHLEETWFQVFSVSNAIAFFCSSLSTLIFLSILTSTYTEKAFLKILPYKLMAGLLTLFISMIFMMTAFTAAFFVAYNHKIRWVPILTSALGYLPAAIFVGLQCSLFIDIFKSTVFSKSLFQSSKPMIC